MSFLTASTRYHDFSPCEVMALCAITQLQKGKLVMRLQGREESCLLPAPVWHNFAFFTNFAASRIKCLGHVEPKEDFPGYSKLERQVVFYYQGQCLATVGLEGVKLDSVPDEKVEEASLWAIRKMEYRKLFFCHQSFGG